MQIFEFWKALAAFSKLKIWYQRNIFLMMISADPNLNGAQWKSLMETLPIWKYVGRREKWQIDISSSIVSCTPIPWKCMQKCIYWQYFLVKMYINWTVRKITHQSKRGQYNVGAQKPPKFPVIRLCLQYCR